ncbi:hypothetical protein, partial [Staphylococcus hominis]|uniref:hypothetical protein n=1 Tax=Staphylococcus hominis TaxID=1290 RepID=UPI001C92ECEC
REGIIFIVGDLSGLEGCFRGDDNGLGLLSSDFFIGVDFLIRETGMDGIILIVGVFKKLEIGLRSLHNVLGL